MMEVPQPESNAPLPIECRLALGRGELSGRTAAILESCCNECSDVPGLVFLDINGLSGYGQVQLPGGHISLYHGSNTL